MQGTVYLTLIMYFSIELVCDCGILDVKFYHLELVEDQQLKLLLLTRSPDDNKSPPPPRRKKDAKLHLKFKAVHSS